MRRELRSTLSTSSFLICVYVYAGGLFLLFFFFFFLCMPSKATNPSLPLLCFDHLPAWRVVFMGSYYSGQLNIEGVLSKVYIYTYVCLQLYLESPMISTKREWTKMGRGGDREAAQMCL